MFETWYKMASMLQSGLDITRSSRIACRRRTTAGRLETMKTGHSGKIILDSVEMTP